MSVTVRLADAESIRLTANAVETVPPDRLEFTLRGRLTMTEALLAQFEGATLNPVRIAVSADGDPVEIDLTASAALRLEDVDVGVATPDPDDITDGVDALRPSANDDPDGADVRPDVLAFTVEGAIRDVPPATLAAIVDDAPGIESATFAVEEPLRSDGGEANDVVFELTLFGYGIVVRRDGTIVVGSSEGLTGIDLP
ncbi:hypothetical protein C488_00829 [Natrinema pellirubrum DSM 15624]|uniref:Uncharacterized protein n=1 Tax=Natrinema pellirubrum (strain DSM 15624 / CIP 106293 / JCM 10476 / NCIMB 786 / 157) TaxID=797303 RepID=L0JKH4_NATP1|nr:hypothetical protein [Natrinema pellirubrum]AGB31328.1 hypothetical protein Natpe_1424 [Natrinema pellirubrum DSM 15624]ELY81737.1 hypothetical protein C488_00829 [Natrinema pellirubrum DSM 15624]